MESIGKVLKKARLEKKLRLKDVYAQTKINPVYLKALENDTADNLPSPEYARIFLKGYADFLGLDTKKLLTQYDQCSEPSRNYEGKNTDEKTKKKVLLFSIIGLTLILSIIIVFTVRHFVNTVNDITTPPALDEYVKNESELLELKFTIIDKTWVRIYADGKKLFGGTLCKGDDKVWYAKEKFHFWIGNAGGIIIELNGKKMPVLGKKGEVFKKVIVTKDGIKIP